MDQTMFIQTSGLEKYRIFITAIFIYLLWDGQTQMFTGYGEIHTSLYQNRFSVWKVNLQFHDNKLCFLHRFTKVYNILSSPETWFTLVKTYIQPMSPVEACSKAYTTLVRGQPEYYVTSTFISRHESPTSSGKLGFLMSGQI